MLEKKTIFRGVGGPKVWTLVDMKQRRLQEDSLEASQFCKGLPVHPQIVVQVMSLPSKFLLNLKKK